MPVIATPARLHAHLTIHRFPESARVFHAGDRSKWRDWRAHLFKTRTHYEFVLGIEQSIGLGLHVVALSDKCAQVFRWHMLMVKSHGIRSGYNATQIVEVCVIADDHVSGYLSGGRIMRACQNPN